jgi:hypothetical protein
MKLYKTESLSEQRDKLTSYFKLAKKLKNFKMVCTPLVEETDYGYLFAGKCDKSADMWLT